MSAHNTIAWLTVGVSSCLALFLIFFANHGFYEEFLSTSASYGSAPIPRRPTVKTVVTIHFDGNRTRTFESDDNLTYNIVQALDAISRAGHLTFSIRNEKVYSIGGTRGVWKIYKNNEQIYSPLPKISVAPGDYYIFRLQK